MKRGGNSDSIHEAAMKGNEGRVRALLDAGEDPNSHCKTMHHGSFAETPLHLATHYGHTGVVRLLVQRGARPSEVNSSGNTPLHEAAKANSRGSAAAAQLLIEEGGADAGSVNSLRKTPLHVAVIHGNFEIARVLLSSCSADINARDCANDTPLHLATLANSVNPRMLGILLDAGADPNLGDSRNKTPLHTVSQDGRTDAARMLLRGGADPGLMDSHLCQPLHLATIGGRQDTVRILVVEGCADTEAVEGMKRMTALQRAVLHKRVPVHRVLLEVGCSLGSSIICDSSLSVAMSWTCS